MIKLVASILLKIAILYLLGGLDISVKFFVLVANPLSALILAYSLYKNELEKEKVFLILSLDVFIPIVGFLAIGLFLILTPLFRLMKSEEHSDVYDLPLGKEDFEDYSTIKKTLLEEDEVHKEGAGFKSLEVEPYMEVFNGDDLAKKVNAIEKLTEISDRKSIEILKKCLDRDDYEVRYFANGALGKIEQDMMTKIELASDNISRHPTDHIAYNMRAVAYLDAYLLGILDKTLEEHFLECALMDYLTSLSLNQEQSYLYVKITQIYLKLERYEDLVSVAKMALAADIKEEDEVKIKFYLAEASYNSREILNLIDYCNEIKDFETGFQLINDRVDWWTSDSV